MPTLVQATPYYPPSHRTRTQLVIVRVLMPKTRKAHPLEAIIGPQEMPQMKSTTGKLQVKMKTAAVWTWPWTTRCQGCYQRTKLWKLIRTRTLRWWTQFNKICKWIKIHNNSSIINKSKCSKWYLSSKFNNSFKINSSNKSAIFKSTTDSLSPVKIFHHTSWAATLITPPCLQMQAKIR